MKNNGFTLIELLAVIVILAIIALIAIPTISGILSKTEKSSAESSAMGYLESVEQTKARNLLNNDDSDNLEEGVYSLPLNQYNIKVKGQVPTKGWIEITKNGIGRYSLLIGDYTVSYDGTEKNVVKESNLLERPKVYPEYIYANPSVVTFIGYPIDSNIDLGEKYVSSLNGYNIAFDSEQECDNTSQALGINQPCKKQKVYTPNLEYLLYPSPKWNGYIKIKLTTDGLIESAEACDSNHVCLQPSLATKSEEEIKQILAEKYPNYIESINGVEYARYKLDKIWMQVTQNSFVGYLDNENNNRCGVFLNGIIGCQKAN